jgi:predicted transposase YbfD/YdcC
MTWVLARMRDSRFSQPPSKRFAATVLSSFSTLPDPRVERTRVHPLGHILFIALSAVMSGGRGWEDMQVFGEERRHWLEGYLDLRSGIPSADTFRRVFEALDPTAVEQHLQGWVRSLLQATRGQGIHFDGKAVKGAVNRESVTQPLFLLHVFASEQGLLLGQRRIAGASGEVEGLLGLLSGLMVQGAVLTADANGCCAEVTRAAREHAAHYLLQVKGNRGKLYKFVVGRFEALRQGAKAGKGQLFRTQEKNRGRLETRTVWTLEVADWPASKAVWADRRTAVMVKRERTVKGRTTVQWHYYITDLAPRAKKLAGYIRGHWRIENGLHWVLDMTFGEDSRRVRDANAAQNMATLTRLALMLLKRVPSKSRSIAQRLKRAAWGSSTLEEALSPKNTAF